MRSLCLGLVVLIASAWAATLQSRANDATLRASPPTALSPRSDDLLDLPLRDLGAALRRRAAQGMTREQARAPKPGASAGSGMPCRKLADCQCDNKRSMSCLNGKCLCGADNKVIAEPATAMTAVVADGLRAAGPVLSAVAGGMSEGIRLALKLGTWVISAELPGAAKAALKALDQAWPPTSLGNEKVDDIMKKINSVL